MFEKKQGEVDSKELGKGQIFDNCDDSEFEGKLILLNFFGLQ